MTTPDVERVAAALAANDAKWAGISWERIPERIKVMFRSDARAAMAATREIDAETARRLAGYAARPMTDDAEYYRKWISAADWLQQRANDVKETGRG